MAVMTERPQWSDERLDDLSARVGDLNRRMDAGFAELRAEMNAGFAELRAEMKAGDDVLRAEMKAGFDAIHDRFDRMQQTLIIIGAGMIGTLVTALIAAVTAAILLA